MSPKVLEELNTLRMEAAKQPKRETETVVNFSDRQGTSSVVVKGLKDNDETATDEFSRSYDVKNSIIAKHVFLGLLQYEDISDIARDASDSLTKYFEFSNEEAEWPYHWCEIPWSTVKNCLLYLETKRLVAFLKAPTPMSVDKWVATPKGRVHAVYIKAMQEFS